MIWISSLAVPTIITVVIIVGLKEKKDVYNLFCEGAKEGIKTMITMFPTLIAIFLAIGMFRNSGLIEFLTNSLNGITKMLNIPNEIVPLIFIKPISGSASMALATDLMTKFGVDSKIGMLAGTIMSSSETTFYVIALYLGVVKIKRSGKILIPALLADIACIIVTLLII